MQAGYLYVLVHPSDPNLYKVGMTTRHPDERLKEHNGKHHGYTGQVVRETGQKWEIKTYISVPDTYWAEAIFWGATGLADIPYRGGVEVAKLEWKTVESGLNAVKKSGVRPLPGPVADYIYAYRAWMNKRLLGRGITLLGHVRSKYGKSNFRCDEGHEWRTTPSLVAEGEGCPQCGMGTRDPNELRKSINVGVVCLLLHSEKPGAIKLGVTNRRVEECFESWGGWQVHRYRNVEEPALAKSLFWELLGHPQPVDDELADIDLHVAEAAFRELHYRLVSKIALVEKAKEIAANKNPLT